MKSAGALPARGVLGHLGRWSARHPWWVIGLWLVLTVGVSATANRLGRLTTEDVTIPGSDAQSAVDLQAASFPTSAVASQRILVTADVALTDESQHAALVASGKNLRAIPEVTGVTIPGDPGTTTTLDGQAGYITVDTSVSSRNLTPALADQIVTAAQQPLGAAGITATAGEALARAQEPLETRRSELIGLLAALIILVVAFGTVAAALVPIGVAAIGLAVSLALIGLLGHLVDIPAAGPTIASMIGLGVGIDYALFISSRYRERLRLGLDPVAAVTAAAATSGRAVVFAGSSVVVALLSLLLVPLPILHALGISASIAVVVAVLAAVTLLPAVLRLLGVRALRRRERPLVYEAESGRGPNAWARLGTAVSTHPVRWLLPTLVVLGLLALPALDLRLGAPDGGSWPPGTAVRTSYDATSAAFGPGATGPLLVVAQLADYKDPVTGAIRPKKQTLEQLTAAMRSEPGVARVSGPQLSADGRVAQWSVTPTTAPSDQATADLVGRLRTTVLPGAAPTDQVHVGGQTAARIDLGASISAALPRIVGLVVLLSAFLLLLAFRAPVVALKAAVMNLVSVAAAYGVLTMVFTWGWGAGVLGLTAPVPIESFVPLLMFAVLFGLSMDYEVFLLSAVQEEYLAGHPTREAVARGLGRTGTVISSAALVMVVVFASFTLLADPVVKMFGVGLAAAVAIDATIVRGVLVPSTMALLDDLNWWCPAWLARILPNLDVEGHGVVGQEALRASSRTDVVERV